MRREPRGPSMVITVASSKGGVGKTTTAIHLANYLQTHAPTLLLDGDETRNATVWRDNGQNENAHGKLAFTVADLNSGALLAPKFTHIVIDTGQRPRDQDLKALAEGCDLLVIPTVPAGLDTVGLVQTVNVLREKAPRANYKVLITKAPPAPETEAQKLRAQLIDLDIPVFARDIPRLKVFDRAFEAGVTVAEVKGDPNVMRAWTAYYAVAKEILDGK